MKLLLLEQPFSVARLASAEEIPCGRENTFAAHTADEVSLVCESRFVPAGALAVESGLRGLCIDGVLDFGMVGVIAGLSGLLAEKGIPIFVVSTYRTDYLFLREEYLSPALAVLRGAGHEITDAAKE